MELVDRIIDIQETNRYTDQQMADVIGCSRPTYQRTRTKKIPEGSIFIKGALKILYPELNNNRVGEVNRKTKETKIRLKLDIDSNGKYDISTGIEMFDHLLKQVAQHGRFGITLSASKWDDQHHLIEDVAICLGQALKKALKEKRGIVRMGDATVIMDDALATVAVDISGRGYTKLELDFSQNSAEWQLLGFPPDLIRQFLESFAAEAKLNLYAKVLDGTDDHHKAEVLFKALGRALDMATRIDPRISGELPTTKGMLED
ncbi:MAG: imidazoleglycerol-phosphate dehydratase [Dehalococcoidales bacterium]|nr:imidazoleglycerol-phosphate dehydratase [Dehalococcoidales bacterium]